MRTVAKVLIIVLGLAFIGILTQERLKPQKSAAEIEKERAAAETDRKRQAAAYAAAKVLRQAMRDPDSFVIESASVSEDASLVCVEYRSRNGFGGMNREFAVFNNGKPFLKDAVAWNKRCTRPLFDQTAAAKKAD